MVPHQIGVLRVVGNKHHAHAALAGSVNESQHHAGLLYAERGRGLVQDDVARTEVNGTRDGDHLALAAGECGEFHGDVAKHNAHLSQLVVRNALHLFLA